MVSTRGVRYKFSEGERVLCYEPDPTKAKVLYDSKVLEVIESKDKRGRRTMEYLIHFQGWNSSWDRCVSEDFVLKDTEENRQLQRDLAEKSQLQLGAYLYRRERKKGSSTSTTGPGPAKRPRHGLSDDGSSSSTQPDYNTEDDGCRPHTPEDDSSRSAEENVRVPSPPIAFVGRAVITLPSALRDRLTFDYHLVVKRGRLSQLPATPCVALIFESFVKWYARAGAWHPMRARNDPQQRPNFLEVSCRLNLCREVTDGMRVYFDCILRNHLLYRQEVNQYHEVCGQFIDENWYSTKAEMSGAERCAKIQPMQEAFKKRSVEAAEEYDDEPMATEEPAVSTAADENLKSPKLPDYSHLPPDPMDADKSDGESNTQDDGIASKSDSNDKTAAIASDSTTDDNQAGGSGKKTRKSRPATRSGMARRLRSHKSQSENEEPTPSTSTGEPKQFETMSSSAGSSGSSLSECWARPARAAPPSSRRTPLSLLLDKVAKWQIIPREGTEHLPCRMYGAIHLARLFVKLPDFLSSLPQMSDYKLKVVLKYIDLFIHYLEQHSEWFGEIYYFADPACRSR